MFWKYQSKWFSSDNSTKQALQFSTSVSWSPLHLWWFHARACRAMFSRPRCSFYPVTLWNIQVAKICLIRRWTILRVCEKLSFSARIHHTLGRFFLASLWSSQNLQRIIIISYWYILFPIYVIYSSYVILVFIAFDQFTLTY